MNTIAYFRMGLRDGVNQNFFILSVADALQGLVALVDNMLYIFAFVSFQFDTVLSFTLHTLCGIAYAFPLSVSIITTTVIAVVRCCCVTMPFNVQKALSARRQLAAILFFCGTCMAMLIYATAHLKIQLKGKIESAIESEQDVFSSASVFQMWNGAIVTILFSSFAIMLTSMLILIKALRKSSRLHRQAANSVSFTSNEIRSARDMRIVRGIFLVLAVFIACNFPIIAIAILRFILPGFTSFGIMSEEFFYLDLFRSLCLIMNTSVNIFVYYFNNSRFRKEVNVIFLGMFRREIFTN
ncbi:hypothetical protein RRG08_024606 [Elysia crispata]|uniref:G-protein coupled receptors family 1 profile domain-containing protein n=1 Tax=Elysia crispata TaxID=231223 RepID=A0AAE0ZW96_9GAST|nr:hypothetical protein RRG08_024606 [Elysia crispata]